MTPHPTNLLLLTWRFDLNRAGSNEDIAEFSIACHQDDYEADQGGLNAITAGAFKAWKDEMPVLGWGTNVRLASTLGTQYKSTGETLRVSVFVPGPDPADGWAGTANGPALPWETALACSLYAYPRGSFQPDARRWRGRFYLPPMSASVLDGSNSGYWNNSGFPEFVAHCADFLGKVGRDTLGVYHVAPGIWSRKDNVVRDAVQLSMDAKFDSQRRRQNREVAGHLEVAL